MLLWLQECRHVVNGIEQATAKSIENVVVSEVEIDLSKETLKVDGKDGSTPDGLHEIDE